MYFIVQKDSPAVSGLGDIHGSASEGMEMGLELRLSNLQVGSPPHPTPRLFVCLCSKWFGDV